MQDDDRDDGRGRRARGTASQWDSVFPHSLGSAAGLPTGMASMAVVLAIVGALLGPVPVGSAQKIGRA
ncbi:MAG: hypothetical protein K2X54_14875, partial [Methylobacterium organophilum]|nr:hypothetical protein [Methylobacterium organophilum]